LSRGNNSIREGLKSYFSRRARQYDHSSGWVDDKPLINKIRRLARVSSRENLLDIAIGTGKIAQAFTGRAKYVVGLDICPKMAAYAKGKADKIFLADAEKLPFKNDSFDACVCRQGMQFMELDAALSEIYRVLKPGGRVILCHLAAYGKLDSKEAFLIQKLRNPARKNFFLPGDFARLMRNKSFADIEASGYITRESVNRWIANSAIDEDRKNKIRKAYVNSSRIFRRLHHIEFKDGDIFDSMKMVIVRASKRKGA